MLRAGFPDEGPHVDEAGRNDVAGAVADAGAFRRGGGGDGGAEAGDAAVLHEDAAPAFPAAGGVDQAGVDEGEGARHARVTSAAAAASPTEPDASGRRLAYDGGAIEDAVLAEDTYDIVVIGAGAAGLAAGTALAGRGFSFVVLEARDRPGGRAWTVRLETGEAVDLGCGWLHSADVNPLAPLAERRGFSLDKSPPPWSRPGAQIGPLAAEMEGFAESIGHFRERVERQAGTDVASDALLAAGDRFNPLIDAVSTWYSGAELRKVSAVDLATYEDSGVNWRVREGYGAVIAALAEGLPLRYGCPVLGLDHSGKRLVLRTPQGAIAARAAIVTLPTDVLAAQPDWFFPALPEKTEAAANLPLGLADKLYMALSGPDDIPADSRAFGKLGVDTGAYHFRPLGRPLVEGYFGGELAAALEHGGEAAAWDFAAGELRGLFGAEFVKRLRPMAFHGWRTDPYAKGGYSYARPGFAGSRRALAEPVEGRLFFAGEACSPGSFSTAHGAYETGLEAARRAVAALGG